MRFGRRLKRTTKQYIIVAFICISVIGSAAIATSFIMIGQIREEYEYMLGEVRREIGDNKRYIYVSLDDIRRGEILSLDKVEKRLVYSSEPDYIFITEEELGKAAIIDIPKDCYLIKGMLAKNPVSSILREVEYDVIYHSSNIEVNDYVDIRIFFPNGESYVVLSKKPLKGIEPGTPICYLWVDEEELLRMSAAIVDAGLYSGSKLYMTKYIEPNIQDSSVITYTPSVSVLSLIENDPNIVNRCSQVLNKEVRKALENRLADNMTVDISEISWELGKEIRYIPEILDESLSRENALDEPMVEEDILKESSVLVESMVEEASIEESVLEESVLDQPEHMVNDLEVDIYFPELGITDEEETYVVTEG